MISESVYRRMLYVGAGLVIGMAAILAFGVIPPVRADLSPMASPGKAVPAIWVSVIAHLLIGAILLGTFLVTRRGGRARKGLLWAAAIVALLLGLLMVDGAFAYLDHPGLHGVAVWMFVCVGCDLAAGVLALTTAVARRRQPPSR
jgi:hypothetical protein